MRRYNGAVMRTTTPITADQLARMTDDGARYELVDGVLHMMSPSGWRHGEIVGNLHGMLWQHVRRYRLGKLFGAETGFLIKRDPDTVRAPDIALVLSENLPEKEPTDAFWPSAPDLAVEVVSPGDRAEDVGKKVQAWIDGGARAVWVVDARRRVVEVHGPADDPCVYDASREFLPRGVVPGFRCATADIFSTVR